MKAECSREILKNILITLDRVTGKNLSLPSLSFIYIRTNKNKLLLRATNLDIGVEVSIPAKILHEGCVLIPGQLLISVLYNSLYEIVTLEEFNGNITLSTPTYTSVIKCISSDDYPNLPKTSKENEFVFESKNFISGIQSVVFSSAVSDIKPEIASVYIYTLESELYFVSTDGFRLAEKKYNHSHSTDSLKIIIPFKNAIEIGRILENAEEHVSIYTSPSLLLLESGGYIITSRLIDGVYPDYPQLIPSSFSTTIKAPQKDIHNTLKSAHIFCDKTNQIQLTIHSEGAVFEVHSQNSEKGEYSEKISSLIDGEDVEMNVNVRYLSEVFPILKRSTTMIGCNGKGKPLLIKDDGDNSFLYLVMPMNR